MPGTVGYALPKVRVRVADSKGRRVAAGDVGVLEVKGPNVFKGYWRNPKKTREEFRKDGYFITGDLATKDADGRVTIVGRANELPGVDESIVAVITALPGEKPPAEAEILKVLAKFKLLP